MIFVSFVLIMSVLELTLKVISDANYCSTAGLNAIKSGMWQNRYLALSQ